MERGAIWTSDVGEGVARVAASEQGGCGRQRREPEEGIEGQREEASNHARHPSFGAK